MMTLSNQRNFTNNCVLKDMKGSWCCVFKVHQYTIWTIIINQLGNSVALLIKWWACEKSVKGSNPTISKVLCHQAKSLYPNSLILVQPWKT